MQDFVDILKNWQVVLGFFVFLFTTLIGGFNWWDRRARRYVDAKAGGLSETNVRFLERLGKLETDVETLQRDVTTLGQQVRSLPTQRDFSEIKASLAGFDATLRELGGMTKTLYSAAIEAAKGQKG